MKDKIHLVNIGSVYPSPTAIDDIFKKVIPQKHQAFASKSADLLKIKSKYTVLDFEQLPDLKLSKGNMPVDWMQELWSKASENISVPISEVGFFATAFNVSGHQQKLPNLSSQIAYQLDMKLKSAPKQFYQYGCAGGILALQEAVDFCQHHDEPALVFVYDQCSIEADFSSINDDNIKERIKSYLLFADAGGLMLLMNDATRKKYQIKRSFSIEAVNFIHEHLDELRMDESGLELSKNIQKVLPALIKEKVISQLLKEQSIEQEDIKSWAFHTGGTPILKAIQQYLGLSDEDINPSIQTLMKYGNTSSASVFLTLTEIWNSHVKNQDKKEEYGAAIAFGSGFYAGGFIFKKNTF